MTDDGLTSALPTEGLSAEDAAVFERVWRRVMAGREQPESQNSMVPLPQKPELPAPAAGQADNLLEHIRMQSALWRASQALARRATGSMARVLNGVVAEDRRQLARLAAAWYIMTGQRWRPEEGNAVPPHDLMEGLRQKYLHLQASVRKLEQAAQMGEDTFGGLYADLARHNQEHAHLILRLLEQMQL